MSVGRPRTAPEPAAAGSSALGALEASGGAGQLPMAGTLAAGRSDAIVLSARAAALLRVGLAVRAVILHALEEAHRRLRVASGRTIVLEFGFYR